jgi:hypothetical protein
VDQQDLAGKAEAARRLLDEAGDLVGERLGVPVLEDALPRLEQDPSHRMSLAEPAVRQRLRAWPILNILDSLAMPLIALVRRNISPVGGEVASLDACLGAEGRSLSGSVQAVFAQLNNAYVEIGPLYGRWRLWESPESQTAAADLRARLLRALEAQKVAVAERFHPKIWMAPVRWLLTIGAAAWFILLQPLISTALDLTQFAWRALIERFVEILSASMLLTNVGFVMVYLVVLWAGLRISTTRRVAHWRRRMMSAQADDPEVSLPAQTVEWMQSLLSPLDARQMQLSDLAARAISAREHPPEVPASDAAPAAAA